MPLGSVLQDVTVASCTQDLLADELSAIIGGDSPSSDTSSGFDLGYVIGSVAGVWYQIAASTGQGLSNARPAGYHVAKCG